MGVMGPRGMAAGVGSRGGGVEAGIGEVPGFGCSVSLHLYSHALPVGKAEGPLAYLYHPEEERRAQRAFYRRLLAYWRRAAEMVLREAQEGLGLEVYPFPAGGLV